MRELSVFCDESGIQEGGSAYYLVTVVFHDQAEPIEAAVAAYEQALADKGLPDIPFHATPLLRAHDSYSGLSVADRKKLLAAFGVLVQRLPVRYKTFVFRNREFSTAEDLGVRIRKALVEFLFDKIAFFQSFDVVKVYYDNGQAAVSLALRSALEYVLSRNVAVYRNSDYRRFRLSQVADYLCEIELAAAKYEHRDETRTDLLFFGSTGTFKRNYLKQARRKTM